MHMQLDTGRNVPPGAIRPANSPRRPSIPWDDASRPIRDASTPPMSGATTDAPAGED
jgi:hypothetical protein